MYDENHLSTPAATHAPDGTPDVAGDCGRPALHHAAGVGTERKSRPA
ncbi:hypothetical protein [Streptomyces sp. NBC_01465]|nr:hypothetical protein [Streptomyces sp. NBC_01465]